MCPIFSHRNLRGTIVQKWIPPMWNNKRPLVTMCYMSWSGLERTALKKKKPLTLYQHIRHPKRLIKVLLSHINIWGRVETGLSRRLRQDKFLDSNYCSRYFPHLLLSWKDLKNNLGDFNNFSQKAKLRYSAGHSLQRYNFHAQNKNKYPVSWK